MQGWIKLHRKILSNPIVCKDGDYLAVWVYLLLNATHKNHDVLFKGQRITLKPGQLLTGRKSISNQLSISESKVKRILLSFESDQQINRQRSNQNSLITILNWCEYQESDQQTDQPVTSERPASDQRVTTNKNVKNDKNVKNERNIYDQIPPELHKPLKDYVESRKKLRKPMTDKAMELILKKLNKLSDGDTHKAIKILEQSVERGWVGVFPLKQDEQRQSGNPFDELLKEELRNEQNRNYSANENNKGILSGLLPGQGGD